MKSLPSRQKDSRLKALPNWVAPALILLLALGLRLFRLAEANLWWDEALAIWGVRKGLAGVTVWTAGDVHPPLYFWSLWSWVQLFGESPWAMRSLSVLFGVLTVAAVYGLGTLIAGRRLGNLAALLTALARFHVWWSQEMRMYVLAGLLGVLSLYFFLHWLRGERDEPRDGRPWCPNRALLLYGLCATGALYTIFLMGALILVQNVVVLLVLLWPAGRIARGRVLRKWVLTQLGILALVGVWLYFSWGRMPTWSVASPMGPLSLARLYATLLTTGVSVDIGRYTWAVLYPLAICLLGLGCLLPRWRRAGRIEGMAALDALTLTLSCTLTAAVVYAATMPRSLFYTPHIEARYFLPFAPAFWLLLAWAVLLIAERWRRLGWLAGATVVVLFILFLPGHYSDRFRRDTLETMSRSVVSQARSGDALLLDSGSRYPVFLYDYERVAPEAWRPALEYVSKAEEPLTRGAGRGRLDVPRRRSRAHLAGRSGRQPERSRAAGGPLARGAPSHRAVPWLWRQRTDALCPRRDAADARQRRLLGAIHPTADRRRAIAGLGAAGAARPGGADDLCHAALGSGAVERGHVWRCAIARGRCSWSGPVWPPRAWPCASSSICRSTPPRPRVVMISCCASPAKRACSTRCASPVRCPCRGQPSSTRRSIAASVRRSSSSVIASCRRSVRCVPVRP